MLTSLICGSFHDEELEYDGPWSCGNSPKSLKRSKRNSFIRRSSSEKDHSKNPYSRIGLEKFSALLSDLEEKKKNIYLQRDSHDIQFVRFVYSGSEEVIPVIVKSKERTKRKQHTTRKIKDGRSNDQKNKPGREGSDGISPVAVPALEQVKEAQIMEVNDKKNANKGMRFAWEMNMEKWGRPSYYLPIFLVLILLLLTIFGRSFAILCTSIVWYLVPAIKERKERTSTGNKKTSGTTSRAISMKNNTEYRATSPKNKELRPM